MGMTPEIHRKGNEAREINAKRREEEFCQEYVTNGYDYLAAYKKVFKTTNDSTLRSGACRMMKRETVKARIAELQKEHYEMLNINAERIAEELANMAFAAKGDEDYTAQIKLKALDLLQKQLGLQTKNLKAEVDNTVEIKVGIKEDEN